MNQTRVNTLERQVQHLKRLIAKEMGLTFKQYNLSIMGYASRAAARRGAERLKEREAANKAGFLTIKAWKHAKEKKK